MCVDLNATAGSLMTTAGAVIEQYDDLIEDFTGGYSAKSPF